MNYDKKFKMIEPILLDGSFYVGEFESNYSTLVKWFGEPKVLTSGKTDVSWWIGFEDGAMAQIYNYKNGKNYMGKYGIPIEDIKEWTVGGWDRIVIEYIRAIIEK